MFFPLLNVKQVLMKWGEYSSDVHFILQRTALDSSPGNKQSTPNNKTSRPVQSNKNQVDPLHGFTPPAQIAAPTASTASTATISPSKDIKKSLTFSGGRAADTRNNRTKQIDDEQQKAELIDSHAFNGSGGTSNDANQLVYPRYEPPYGRVHQPSNGGAVSPDHTQQDHVRFPPPYRNPPPPAGN